jgi:hypothetical protein
MAVPGMRFATAQSASSAIGGSNGRATSSRGAPPRAGGPAAASRWTAGSTNIGTAGASSWGVTMSTPGLDSAPKSNAKAESFGYAAQPGGIWGSTGKSSAGLQIPAGAGKATTSNLPVGNPAYASGFLSSAHASNSSTAGSLARPATTHASPGTPFSAAAGKGAGDRLEPRAGVGTSKSNSTSQALFGNASGSHRSGIRSQGARRGESAHTNHRGSEDAARTGELAGGIDGLGLDTGLNSRDSEVSSGRYPRVGPTMQGDGLPGSVHRPDVRTRRFGEHRH